MYKFRAMQLVLGNVISGCRAISTGSHGSSNCHYCNVIRVQFSSCFFCVYWCYGIYSVPYSVLVGEQLRWESILNKYQMCTSIKKLRCNINLLYRNLNAVIDEKGASQVVVLCKLDKTKYMNVSNFSTPGLFLNMCRLLDLVRINLVVEYVFVWVTLVRNGKISLH